MGSAWALFGSSVVGVDRFTDFVEQLEVERPNLGPPPARRLNVVGRVVVDGADLDGVAEHRRHCSRLH
ncbi:hypothetical protein [Aeromicrobium sp.]|uniref:hypothetical protein n=1 Tax=Aeromicrobium sp. TaxID=1871063 RepID=UPI002FC7BD8B